MPVSKGRNKRKTSKNNHKPTRMAHNVEISQSQRDRGNVKPVQERSQSYYQGIIPSPEMMEKYKGVDETLPGRLVTLTEDEAAHRRGIENKITTHAFVTTLIGQIFAFLAVGLICGLSYMFMINGNAEAGKYIAISIIVSLAALFLGRKVFVKKENKK